MGRSKESLRRKRSSGSRDSGYFAKRHTANPAYRVGDYSGQENVTQSSTFESSNSFCDVATYAQIPYYSWTTFFFNQEYDQTSTTVARINAFIEFFERRATDALSPNEEEDLNFDINDCFANSTLLQKWPSLREDMNANPRHTFNCINTAFFEVTLQRWSAYNMYNFVKIFRIVRLMKLHIINHRSINALPCFNLSSYGKLVCIMGIVINTGAPKPSSAFVTFACSCKREIIVAQEHGTYLAPRKCNVCGNAKFTRLLDSLHQFTKLEQAVQIKDHRSMNQTIDTSAPNIISVKLSGTLVDKFVPGAKITVIGIPRITLGLMKTAAPGSCPLYLDAISMFSADDGPDNVNSDIPIDRNIIESIRAEPDVLRLLVNSLCPAVQSCEIIKAALILELCSGSCGYREIRDYAHTLIIGDMGLGKSQLLRACAQVASKAVYVRGSSMKSLEPTTINVREAGVEDARLEAGAFSLASEGVCFIDELDKISGQHQSIHACMEDRTANITNPELKLDLEARTAIVAMINPIKKRYDLSKTIVENVNASQEILSRFDMIFLMRDKPDTYSDKLMCDRMLDASRKRAQLTELSNSSTMSADPRAVLNSRTLTERLVSPYESRSDILPEKLVLMYVHYARTYVKPEMSSSAKAAIELQCAGRYGKHKDLVNIERLVRVLVILSQARAKVSLREEIEEQDVYDGIEILGYTRSVETKDRPLDRPLSSSSSSNKLTTNKVNQFLGELRNEAVLLDKMIFTTDELRTIAGKENFTPHSLSNLLSKLNEMGYLLKVSCNTYRLVSH